MKICIRKLRAMASDKKAFKIEYFQLFVQSDLPIADILYNGHLVKEDTFLRNRPNHGQILIEKLRENPHRKFS